MDKKGIHNLRLVFWETTAACNLECAHCRRLEVRRELSQKDLTTEQARQMIQALAEFAKPVLVLSGGEPLMRPDIFDLAGEAARAGLPVALATNGTLVSDEAADRIRACGIRRVAISFDGALASTHDSFRRQEGSFAAALAALRRLRARGVPTQINTTVTRHNVEELGALYQMALREGADALHLFMLVPVGCGVQIAEDQMLSAERYESVLNWLYEISKEGKIQTKATCAPHYMRIVRQRDQGMGEGRGERGEGRQETAARNSELGTRNSELVSRNS
ncbi:MAG: radical SAM protein, partial [Candidatus Sumerlaeota bacterium]|nr:radical SAM protein [Candidatus Sumerlaeota bacterium]